MDVVVREARESELDEIGALTVEIYDGLVTPEYLEILRDARTRWASPATKLLVAYDDGTDVNEPDSLLGTVVYGGPGSPWVNVGVGDEAEIRMLGVRESARDRGVGESLVRACMALAKAAGTPRLVLCTQTDMTAAQRLYERLGFARVPERDWTLRPGLSFITYVLEVAG